jgi:hypothetical protein
MGYRDDYIDLMAGLPQTAADLLQCPTSAALGQEPTLGHRQQYMLRFHTGRTKVPGHCGDSYDDAVTHQPALRVSGRMGLDRTGLSPCPSL